MQIEINIEPTLALSWRETIERQLNLALASLHWQVYRLDVDLESVAQEGNDASPQARYCCRLQAELRVGRTECITVFNSDPQICVADAAARLRRVVARDKQLGLMGRAS